MLLSKFDEILTLTLICALWSPAGKGLTSWLSFVVSNCEFVTFPLVSWVRYGIVRPANRDWACQRERCHTLSNKTSLQ